jgi:hypothetical protein
MNNPTIMAKLFFIISSPENQPRRNEGNEGRSEKTFVLFVSSWLIFILLWASPIATRTIPRNQLWSRGVYCGPSRDDFPASGVVL